MVKPSCAVQVVFNIKPEHSAAFHEIIQQQAHNSLSKEAWCHQFDVGVNPDRPHSFHLYETYDDRAALEKHRKTDHFAKFTASIDGWVESKAVSIWDIL